jgi:hypothetical protein
MLLLNIAVVYALDDARFRNSTTAKGCLSQNRKKSEREIPRCVGTMKNLHFKNGKINRVMINPRRLEKVNRKEDIG